MSPQDSTGKFQTHSHTDGGGYTSWVSEQNKTHKQWKESGFIGCGTKTRTDVGRNNQNTLYTCMKMPVNKFTTFKKMLLTHASNISKPTY